MSYFTIASVFVGIFAVTMAMPSRLAYYQQPAIYYQSQSSPQRLMYMQYVQQPSSFRSHSRLTNAAAAFVSGDAVATGTYVKDNGSSEKQIAQESVLVNTGANGAQSVAEAYPAEYPQENEASNNEEGAADSFPESPEDSPILEDEAAPADVQPAENDVASADASPEPAVALAAEQLVPDVSEPAAATVELSEEGENDDDDNESDDDDDEIPNSSRRRQGSPKASPSPLPAGSFFSIDFGGVDGGAIAVSNSLSTGANGSSKSQAIAFGNPDEKRLKSRPSRRH